MSSGSTPPMADVAPDAPTDPADPTDPTAPTPAAPAASAADPTPITRNGNADGAPSGPSGVPASGPSGGSGIRWFLRLSLRPILLYLASRAGMLLVAGATSSVARQPLVKSLTPWDSTWYLTIAGSGYVRHIPPGTGNPAQSDLGFFPLIPLLTRATHLVTGFGIPVAGLVTTFLLGLAAAVAVWWMLRDVFGQTGADRGTALIFFSPGALVLSLVYTEAGTILFVALALMALKRHRWVLAGLAAAVATTADPVGCAAIVPCIVAAVIAIRRTGEWKSLAAPLIAPLGVGTFFAYLWVHTGSPFEYFLAQRAGWQGGTYFGGIPGAIAHLVNHGFADPDYGVKAVSIVIAVGLLVVFFRARPPATWVAYVVAVLAFGAISPIIGVTPRLALRGFPLLGVVGAKLPGLWFEVVFGLSVLSMAALGMMAMGGPLWTP